MTGNEVYKLLHDAGREDAIPEGRVITQGIAAATGFGVGIIKGVGGSILFDLATSNETQQYLANMFDSWNITIPSFGNWNSQKESTTSTPTSVAQEICFNSRSLNEIDDEYDEAGREELDRQTTTGTTGYMEDSEIEPIAQGRQTVEPTSPTVPTLTMPTSGTAVTTSPSSGGSYINCIVINKPVAKKRRRRSINKLIKHTRRSKGYGRRSKRALK